MLQVGPHVLKNKIRISIAMSKGASSDSSRSGAGNAKFATKALSSEDQVKTFIQGSLTKKTESQIQSSKAQLSMDSSDRCVAYITKRQNQARSSNKATQIKGMIEVYIVRWLFLSTFTLNSVQMSSNQPDFWLHFQTAMHCRAEPKDCSKSQGIFKGFESIKIKTRFRMWKWR